MSLELQSEFTADDIRGIRRLDDNRPVFLLAGERGHIVIKRDMTPNPSDPGNMRTALRNMKAVDPAIASRQLTSRELEALATFIEAQMLDAQLSGRPVPAEVTALEGYLNQGAGPTWLKMNKLEGIMNLESAALAARNQGNKEGVRAIAAALSAPGGLEKLGEILAVDLFNGNNDRFDLDDQPQGQAFHGLQFRRLANMGNVVLCLQNDILRPVGLDAYAGMSEFRNFDKPEPPGNSRWPGRHLADTPQEDQWMKAFCEDVAHDLETALGRRNRRGIFALASKSRLPGDAAIRLWRGTGGGVRKLKTKLGSMYSAQSRPPGLLSRMRILNWNW